MVERTAERKHKPTPKEDPFPRRIEPMLSVPIERSPKDTSNWIAELNFPGLRAIAYVNKSVGLSLITRQRDHVEEKFEEISTSILDIAGKNSLILDGIIACSNGHNSQKAAETRAKQNALQRRRNPIRCYFLVNDVLYAEGKNLTEKPLSERKRVLNRILPDRKGYVVQIPYSETDHKNIRKIAKDLKTEVSYRKKNSPYKPGSRSKDWVRKPTRRKSPQVRKSQQP